MSSTSAAIDRFEMPPTPRFEPVSTPRSSVPPTPTFKSMTPSHSNYSGWTPHSGQDLTAPSTPAMSTPAPPTPVATPLRSSPRKGVTDRLSAPAQKSDELMDIVSSVTKNINNNFDSGNADMLFDLGMGFIPGTSSSSATNTGLPVVPRNALTSPAYNLSAVRSTRKSPVKQAMSRTNLSGSEATALSSQPVGIKPDSNITQPPTQSNCDDTSNRHDSSRQGGSKRRSRRHRVCVVLSGHLKIVY